MLRKIAETFLAAMATEIITPWDAEINYFETETLSNGNEIEKAVVLLLGSLLQETTEVRKISVQTVMEALIMKM